MAWLPSSSAWIASSLLIVPLVFGLANLAHAATSEPLFDAPQMATVQDEVLLLSTRSIGTVCDGERMSRGLRCQQLVRDSAVSNTWKTTDWRRLLSQQDPRPTIIYVHGNRVASGKDRLQGLQVYHSYKAHCRVSGPVRFVIWSWPAEPISRPVKDYLVKARRTNPVAWQLAWLIDKMPRETQLALVGYSYGTRIVGGATHILAGGQLGNLQLQERVHPQRPPVRAALIAAAFDADWIQPGNFYGRSIQQFERLVLATNQRDPAMRFFHLSNGLGKMDALGKSGVHRPQSLGRAAHRLKHVDFTREVGRSHTLLSYLDADAKMGNLWSELTKPNDPSGILSGISRPHAMLER